MVWKCWSAIKFWRSETAREAQLGRTDALQKLLVDTLHITFLTGRSRKQEVAQVNESK